MKTRGEILCELHEERPRAAPAKPRRVLVVGARTALRRLIANVYRADGHIALEANGDADSMAQSGKEHAVDLALLDARAEPTATLDIARKLREREPGATIGVVVAQANTSFQLRVRTLGAVVVPLPLRSRVLRTILDALWLNRR